MRECEV